MESLSIHVFKDSIQPISELLKRENLNWSMRPKPIGVPMASSDVIEVVLNLDAWGALATVIIAFIGARHGRRVMITTKDHKIIHADGLTSKDLENVLKNAMSISAFDPKKANDVEQSEPKTETIDETKGSTASGGASES